MINVPQVRVIGAEGENLGVMPTRQAMQIAEEAWLDLVEVSPTAAPPVVRIMDYGKYVFEQKKKLQVAKSKQKQIQIKEVKFRPGTEEGDYQVKLRNLVRFLTEGDKAKVTLRFRGREMMHQDLGRKLFNCFQSRREKNSCRSERTTSTSCCPPSEYRNDAWLTGPKLSKPASSSAASSSVRSTCAVMSWSPTWIYGL
jgi:translation initiation factor IF-3